MHQAIVYSHGFGVRYVYKELLTDIAKAFPDRTNILFDYNQYDEVKNLLTVKPLDEQAQILKHQIKQLRQGSPEITIDIICHSQGCVVAGLAGLENIETIILLAPPQTVGGNKIEKLFSRPGAHYRPDGVSLLPRKDGSTTAIPKAYWESLKGIDAQELYQKLANQTKAHIILANQDEVLGTTEFSNLNNIGIIEIVADHNFTGKARKEVITCINTMLKD